MVEAKIKIALGLIAILILVAPIAIAQEVPAHVVISEVQIATNEFVELYNPTNSDINMTGWHWCYFSPGGNWNKSERDRTFTKGVIIPAHGFYLIATTVGDFPTADWNLDYKVHFLSDTAGSVGIFPWDPDIKTAAEAKAGKIDAVGWGSVTDVYETATASTPGSGESIERKPLGGGYAPCQDTDDNSFDFFKQGTPTPKNSSSLEMEPAPVELFDADGDFKGGFVNIQDAVDNASDEYTIRVDDGTYDENVDVDKQLTICSEYGAAVTTISAPNPNDNVFDVTADYVNISGFNVTGATQKAGIYLCNANYCNISNNSVSNNNIGIHLQMESRYNTITNNNVSDNENGISLSSSDDNHIYNNYFDNANNAEDDKNNIWNITKADGPNIIGGPHLGGNYWGDYAGADTDDDGLGDFLLPYNSNDNIADGGDRHPLVPVGSAPILSIVKSDKPDPVQPGGTLNYTIIVENTGNAIATNVNVTETYERPNG
jgi:parallel beta-helix repeat protein